MVKSCQQCPFSLKWLFNIQDIALQQNAHKVQIQWEVKCCHESTMYCITPAMALTYNIWLHMFWECRHTQTQTWAFLSNDSILFVRPLFHKCVQDVLGSGQIFWNNGLTHSCTHSVSLCIPLSLSFINTHTHTHNTQAAHVLTSICFLRKHGCLPNHRLSTLHYTWHPFNVKQLQAMFKTIKNLKDTQWSAFVKQRLTAWGKGLLQQSSLHF